MAKKKSAKRKWKEKAWKVFSLYIRLKYSDDDGFVNCVTCGANYYFRELQAGHFIAGRCNSILFYEKGVHPQCRRCNYQEGNGPMYFIFMEKTYGRDEIDYQIQLKHQTLKRSEFDYQLIHDEYQSKIDRLNKSYLL